MDYNFCFPGSCELSRDSAAPSIVTVIVERPGTPSVALKDSEVGCSQGGSASFGMSMELAQR